MPSSKTWTNGLPMYFCDVAVRMRAPRISRVFAFSLVLCGVWLKSAAQRAAGVGAGVEVLIKVQIFDNSDLSPLKEAAVQVHGNQSVLASGFTREDGIVTVTFLYRPGTWVIVSASKHGFVTNSAPWHASRIPLYASVSLYLLPQRPATLLLYDDVVQLLLGSPGSRSHPLVQLQRKAIGSTINASQVTLSAMLTSTRSQYELGGFPYPLGMENNSTVLNTSWVELTAVAAVCATLAGPNGAEVQVSEQIQVSVPLPSDSPLKSATSVPVWRFEDRTGLWIRSGVGYIKKDGAHMTWTFVASHLGYWLAAFSSGGTMLNNSALRDFTTYHTIFLLAILGFMALLVLILLCLMLYYCRRRCLKPRQHRRKMYISSTLESSKRDQGTSTSHLNLISGGRLETPSSTGDGVKSDLSSTRDSREDFFRCKQRHSRGNSKQGESFPLHVSCSTNTNNLDLLLRDNHGRIYTSVDDSNARKNHHLHNAKDNQGYTSNPPSPPQLLQFAGHYQEQRRDSKPPEYSASQVADNLNRPVSMNTQPGQLIFCHSMEQMKDSMYHSVVPTLVIPAHYMRLSTDLSSMEQAVERQQQLQHDMEAIQVSMTLPRQQTQQQQQETKLQNEAEKASQQGEESQDQNWTSDASSGPVHIPVLFNESSMTQMNGELKALTEKKLLELGVKPHPLAWFVSLDGRSNSLVRHSYIELGNEPLRAPQEHHAETYPGNSGRSSQRKSKEERKAKELREPKAHGRIHSKLPVIDTTNPSTSSESHTAPYSPDGSMAPLLDNTPESRGGTFPRKGRSRDFTAHGSTEDRRDLETSLDLETSPDNDDKDDEDENKKSPWQRREERPLMVFK
ncbi:protein FAM171A2 isoform X2 [Silurus meridionalis]|uniref:protein FAM171A2 isoform X2 n=1 Tax=Silurus meridionalis TaxID=175797 RepID=UPI001EEB1EF6|nr:protein FAM171A2 isoform X2 [Silurus meridionalis]